MKTMPLLLLDSVHDSPVDPPAASMFRDPALLAKMRYDGQALHDHRGLQTAVMPTGLPLDGPDPLCWMEARAAEIDAHIARCRLAGIEAWVSTDLIVLPCSLAGDPDLCDADGNFDIRRPACLSLHEDLFNKVRTRFPGLNGIIVRTGENYLHDMPHHTGNSPVSAEAARSAPDAYREVHIAILRLLRQQCERGVKVIYRTWAFGGLHTDPAIYLSITDAVDPHPNLFLSVKHTAGDFHRGFPFNPVIGIGRHRQIIEVQCQREYEGKGAYPNYIVQGVLNGFPECAEIPGLQGLQSLLGNPLFAGIWTWSRGGGWKGPAVSCEFWPWLNAAVIAEWSRRPEAGEEAAFVSVAQRDIGLDSKGIERLRRLCLLSADAVMIGKLSRITSINPFWMRDCFLGGIVPDHVSHAANDEQWGMLNRSFAEIRRTGTVEAVLAEKRRALELWSEIEALSDEIDWPAHLAAPVRASCRYGRHLQAVISNGWSVMLRGWLHEQGEALDRVRLAKEIAAYDDAWKAYSALENVSHYASLFEPCGFTDTPPDFRSAYGLATTVQHYRQLVDPGELISGDGSSRCEVARCQ